MDDFNDGDNNTPVISDYHVPDIVSKDFNKNEILFSSCEDFSEIAEIPNNVVEDDVLVGIRRYVNSHLYQRRYSNSAARRHWQVVSEIAQLASKSGGVYSAIGYDYLNLIKAQIDSETEIFHRMNALKSILVQSSSDDATKKSIVSNELAVAIRKIKSNLPHVKRPPSGKTPSLEAHFGTRNNNLEIQKALRVWCSRFLIEWAYIRHQFKEMMPKEYNLIIDRMRLQNDNESAVNVTNTQTQRKTLEKKEDRLALMSMEQIYFDFALKLEHSFLLDEVFTLFYGYRTKLQSMNSESILPSVFPDGDLFSYKPGVEQEDIVRELSGWVNEDGSLFKTGKQGKHWFNFSRCPPAASLVAPSYEEIIVMLWLIASDDQQRQQKSNLMRAKLHELEEFCLKKIPAIKPNLFKGRSNRTTGSPINQNSKMDVYSALALMKKGMQDGYKLGAYHEGVVSDDKDMMLIPNLDEVKVNYYRAKLHPHGVSNSLSRRHMRDVCSITQVDIEPVHELIEKGVIGPAVNRNIDTILPINCIAETALCAYRTSKTGDLPVLSENLDFNPESDNSLDMEVNALARNHTLRTQLETYFFRSEDRVKLDNGHKFAKLVGDEMVKLAISLANSKKVNAKIMTLQEVEIMLGIKSENRKLNDDVNGIYQEAEMQDYLVNKTGLIEKDGIVIFIKTPFVAHLISAFIQHIDFQLEQIINSNYEYALKLLVHRMFLKAVLLEHFDQKLIRQGVEQYGKYDFPFPAYEGI